MRTISGTTSRLGLALLVSTCFIPTLSVPAAAQAYVITQLTTDSTNHEWPSLNDKGDVVWAEEKAGACACSSGWTGYQCGKAMCWQVLKLSSGTLTQVTSDVHNHVFPTIDNNDDIVYAKDEVGAGPGLEVVKLASGIENAIESSSGNPPACTEPPLGPPTCSSWRQAGLHFGIGNVDAQTISYFDFCSPSCVRTFDVSGVGQFQSLPPAADYPDINSNGGISYYDGVSSVYVTNVTNPNPVLVGAGSSPRINDAGNVVLVSNGQILFFQGPTYHTSSLVNQTGLWADINKSGLIVFEDKDVSGFDQVFQAAPIALTVSPRKLTFATQLVGTTSSLKSVMVGNTGLVPIDVVAIVATGDFTQSNSCPSTLPPGTHCVIDIVFKPTAKGTRAGAVTVTDNAPNSPQKVILAGTGTVVELSPTSLAFGNQMVGTTSAPQTVTLTNVAGAALSVTSIGLTGTDAADFSETNTCGSSVAGGKSCTISVTFKPTAKGTRTAAVSISDNGGGSPQEVTLTGTGT